MSIWNSKIGAGIKPNIKEILSSTNKPASSGVKDIDITSLSCFSSLPDFLKKRIQWNEQSKA